MRRLFGAALLLAFAVLAMPAQAQEAVEVRGGNHDGYGRIVFDWSQPVQYRAFVRNNALHLEFARRASFQTSALFPALNGYIGLGAPGPHGYRITFPMKQPFGVEDFTFGSKVVVDLKDPDGITGLDPQPDAPGGTAAAEARRAGDGDSAADADAADTPDGPGDRQADPASDANEAAENEGAGDEGAPESEPDELPKVRLRVGEHPTYDRLVFDWPKPVGYTISSNRQAGMAQLEFGRRALIDVSAFRAEPPQRVARVTPGLDASGTTVDLRTLADAALRHFQLDNRIVVDVFAPGETPPADGPGTVVPPDGAAVGPGIGKSGADSEGADGSGEGAGSPQPGATREADAPARRGEPGGARGDEAASTEEGQGQEQPAVTQPEPAPEPQPQAEPEPEPEPEPAAPRDRPDRGGSGDEGGVGAPTPLVPQNGGTSVNTNQAGNGGTRATGRSSGTAGPTATAGTGQSGTNGARVAAEGDAGPDSALRYTPEQIARGLAPRPGEIPPPATRTRMKLPWAGRTAAVYRRGEALWLVVTGTAPADFQDELRRRTPGIESAERVGTDPANVYRIVTEPGLRARMSQADGQWTLILANQVALPARPLQVNAEDGRVVIPVETAGPVVGRSDPGSGGALAVVPIAAAGQGMAQVHRFQEFSLLPTTLGVVVAPRAEHVRVRVTDEGIVVDGGQQPLVVSEVDRGDASPDTRAAPDGPRLLKLPAWRREDQSYNAARQDLRKAVVEASDAKRHLARLDLARFFFAHGLATEALGALKLYAREKPRRGRDPQVQLMNGAAQLLAGDWREAGETLAHPALDGVAEALPWRGAHAMVAGNDRAGLAAFERGAPLLDTYPPSVRKGLRLWAAQAYLNLGRTRPAEAQLRKVRQLDPTRSEQAEIDYLTARHRFLNSEIEAAENLWNEVARGDDAAARARARFVMIERDLAAGRIDRDEAIERLERLRFAWRGDAFEAVLLDRLAGLYLSGEEYRKALGALRQAASHLPDTQQATRATERMRDIFERLFLDGEADDLPSVKALALYESFRELTPAGPKGDRMIAKLADRLVRVDLLDRAAALLDGQVRHRLDGAEKAGTGARLASVYLLDRRPEKAVEALGMSEASGISPELALRRQHLRARALHRADKGQQALALLAVDNSEEGLRLKAKINGDLGNWGQASEAFGKLLPPVPDKAEEFAAADAARVMRMAVALTMSGQEERLARLNDRYKDVMAQSDQAESFRLLAQTPAPGEATIQNQLAQVTQAQAFMTDFLSSLKQQAKLDGE